jgi:hypothetical protein
MNFGHPAVNSGSFPPHRSSQPVSYDDYFPRNQNKNDLGKPRSFWVRVERVELPAGSPRHGSTVQFLAMLGQKRNSQPSTPTTYDRLLSLLVGHTMGNAIGIGGAR